MTKVNRRTMLRGVGASLALPFLPSLLPKRAWAQAATPPKRLLYYYVPNGMLRAKWTPAQTGPDYALTELLAPLARHKPDMTVVSGLDNAPGLRRDGDVGGGAHFQQTASFLTFEHIRQEVFAAGKSVDQIAADAVGDATAYRSLVLGTSGGSSSGVCAGNDWPCAYIGHISWADATTPMAKYGNPRSLFDVLFGAANASAEDRAKRLSNKQKVLDVVRDDASSLSSRLGKYDRYKLDRYLTAVNELEDRVIRLSNAPACDAGDEPDWGSGYLARHEAMLDLLVLAFECDITRIATFMTEQGGNNNLGPYSWVMHEGTPLTEAFHPLSHHSGDPVKIAKIAAICLWEMEVFARLLDRMKAVDEGDGTTLLDNSIVFFSSEAGEGNDHRPTDLPIVLAGGGQGSVVKGTHLAYAAPNNIYADLHVALLNAFGVEPGPLGEEERMTPLPGILV
ncbi:MAG: DUF1552 domain-containing protein [Deltaproteobacteria bacterium]|jgi:hypothetical protein